MKVLAIGTASDISRNRFTGQSIMFDGIVNYMREQNVQLGIIDISPRINIGGTLFRLVDYCFVLIELIFKLVFNRYDLSYITTAQSKNGFYRDNAIIGICRLFKVPVVAHQYGANYKQLLNAINDKSLYKLKRMLGYVSNIIVEGDYMKEQFSFLDDYINRVIVIPNGLPVQGKNSLLAKQYDGESQFILLYLSNLIWSKGYFDLLKAVDVLVNKEQKNIKCIFAGRFMTAADDEHPGISNKNDFDLFIKNHQLSDVVEYYPGLYGKEKDEVFCKANVFILPTYYINEGQPVSIIEAMSYGCVPIVTEFRHIPMMINEGNGCFVKPKQPEDIAAAIIKLIENTGDYATKSRQCITDYKEKFVFNKYASRVFSVLESTLS